MRTALLLLLASLSLLHAAAQKNVEDSLEKQLLLHPAKDSNRINTLAALCNKTYNYERGLSAANEIIQLARQLHLPLKEAKGYLYRAGAHYEEGNDSLYIIDSDTAMMLFEKAGDKRGLCIVQRSRGLYNQNHGSYYKAIESYKSALQTIGPNSFNDLKNYLNNDIGTCYQKLGNYTEAIKYYLLSQQYAEKSNDKQASAIAIANIGRVNSAMKMYKAAIEKFRQSQLIYESIGDSAGIAAILKSTGIVYDEQSKSDSALLYFFKAAGINERNGFKKNLAECFANIGTTKGSLGEYTTAYNYMIKAIGIYKQLNSEPYVKQVEAALAELICSAPDSFFIKNNIGKYAKAIELSKNIIEYAKEAEDKELESKGWHTLSLAYEKQKDYANALVAQKNYMAISDSLASEEQITGTIKQTDKFEFDKKEAVTLAKHGLEIKQEQTIKKAIAIGAGIILLGAIASFIFYKRKRDAVARQQEAEFKTEVADTEMKALRSQMNPHFIFNSLNSIGDYIAKNNVQEADRYLSKFAKLMRMILENSEQRDVSIADDLKALELYMQLEALRMNNKFTYEIKVDDDIDKEATLIPPLILQPFVENSIWHGIAQKEGPGKISIHIKKESGNMINCIVEDDGIGRKQSAAIKTTAPKNEKTSLGMKITQARIDILNKIKNSNAAVKLSDLEQGVRVEVRLPLATSF